MSTFRVKKRENPFVQIDKACLKDETLSWKAKGLLAYLLSLPDDWQIYEEEITKHSTDGIKGTKSGIRELIKKGYIHREKVRDDRGRFKGYEYNIYEFSSVVPKRAFGETVGNTSVMPKTDNGKTDNRKTDDRKRHATNKDLTNKDITDNNRTEREAVALSPVDNLHSALMGDFTETAFKTWIANLMITLEGDTVTIKAPDVVTKGMVASKYMSVLEIRLKSFYGANKVILI